MNLDKDQINFGLGLLGSVLGVMSVWHSFDRERIKLRVTPKVAYNLGFGDQRPRLCIEVINLSSFPLIIREVGFSLWFTKTRMAITHPELFDGKPWPRKLESRESVTVYCSPNLANEPGLQSVRRAYAKTDCDETKYGNSKILNDYIRKAEQL